MRVALVLAMLCARAAAADPIEAQLVTELDLEAGHVAKPTSLAPDIWWGVAPHWTIGLVHSHASVDRFQAGASLCLASNDVLACNHVYRGSGLDARYDALSWLAPRARLLVRDIDPIRPALTIGAFIHRQWGQWGLESDPYLQIALANRTQGNDHAIVLPVRGAFDRGAWRAWIDTGWNSDVSVLHDGWHVPVGAGVRARVREDLDLGAELGFPSALGPQNTPKERVLFLFVATRWQS